MMKKTILKRSFLTLLFLCLAFPVIATESILFIGDSQTAIYGRTMRRHLQRVATEVNYYGLSGAAPIGFSDANLRVPFAPGEYLFPAENEQNIEVRFNSRRNREERLVPYIGNLLNVHPRTDIVVIALSGNMISSRKREWFTNEGLTDVNLQQARDLIANGPRGQITATHIREIATRIQVVTSQVRALLSEIPVHIPCVWVGSSKAGDTHQKPRFFYEILKEVASVEGKCAFVEGRVSTFIGRRRSRGRIDPIHYSPEAATELANRLFRGGEFTISDNCEERTYQSVGILGAIRSLNR